MNKRHANKICTGDSVRHKIEYGTVNRIDEGGTPADAVDLRIAYPLFEVTWRESRVVEWVSYANLKRGA